MQSRYSADGGLEDPLTTVHENEIEKVDPKATEFLLRKPWYAGTTYDTDGNADADADADSDSDTERPRLEAGHEMLNAQRINKDCSLEEARQRSDALIAVNNESVSASAIAEERQDQWSLALEEIREELTSLKKVRGGRLNVLRYKLQHPVETFLPRSRT